MVVQANAELSDRLDRDDVNIKLSDQLSLVSGKRLSENLVFSHENERYEKYIKNSIVVDKDIYVSPTQLYFEYRTSGSISNITDTRVSRDFYDQIRSFYGACIAFDLIGDWDFRRKAVQPIVIANSLSGGAAELCYVSRPEDDVIKAANLTTIPRVDKIIKEK